jgi:seryl-tRNA synthetase
MATRYDRDSARAEAEIRQANDEFDRAETALDNAKAMHDRFEDRIGSPGEDDAELVSAMAAVEGEMVGLEEDFRDAETSLYQVTEYWTEEIDDEED